MVGRSVYIINLVFCSVSMIKQLHRSDICNCPTLAEQKHTVLTRYKDFLQIPSLALHISTRTNVYTSPFLSLSILVSVIRFCGNVCHWMLSIKIISFLSNWQLQCQQLRVIIDVSIDISTCLFNLYIYSYILICYLSIYLSQFFFLEGLQMSHQYLIS